MPVLFFDRLIEMASAGFGKQRRQCRTNSICVLRREPQRQSAGGTEIPGSGHHGNGNLLLHHFTLGKCCITGPLEHHNPKIRHRKLQSDNLIDAYTTQRSINIGEAADACGGDQLLVDFTLIAAAVAAHQQHAGLLSQGSQTVSNVIALNQHIAVVEEEHHADNVSTVDALFHLRDDHVFQNLSGIGGFKQVSDFHSNSSFLYSLFIAGRSPNLQGNCSGGGQLLEYFSDHGFAQVGHRDGLVDDQYASHNHSVFLNIIHINACFVATHVNLRILLGQGLHEYPKDLASMTGSDKFNAGILHNLPFLSRIKIVQLYYAKLN